MGEWAIVILLACVTANGISENKHVGLGINEKGEMIIVSPPELDVHLKVKNRVENVYLMSDDGDHLYSVQLNKAGDKFIFFIHRLESEKIRPNEHRSIKIDKFKALDNITIATMDPKAETILETAALLDQP